MSKFIDGTALNGLLISVNHPKYGVLFAAMIEGNGTLVSTEDEMGIDVPFLTTGQILKQLEKFGFLIKYDVKTNLPDQVVTYLSSIYNLGFDKINMIYVPLKIKGSVKYRKAIIAINTEHCDPRLVLFGEQVPASLYTSSLDENLIINITDAVETDWSWLTYSANIADILDENIDKRDDFKTITDAETEQSNWIEGQRIDNSNLTPYSSEEAEQGL